MGNMLENCSLANFKAFQRDTDVPLAPVTLIFGDNASGKSAILQSLALLAQSTPDFAQDTYSGIRFSGSFVDLGGFANVISRHDESQDMVLSLSAHLPQERDSVEASRRVSGRSMTLNISLTIGKDALGSARVKAADLHLQGVKELFVHLRAPSRSQMPSRAQRRQTLEATFDPTLLVEFARAELDAGSSSRWGSMSGSQTIEEAFVETYRVGRASSGSYDWPVLLKTLETAMLASQRVEAYGPFEAVLSGPWPSRFRLAQGVRESFEELSLESYDPMSPSYVERVNDSVRNSEIEESLQVVRRFIDQPVRQLMRQLRRIQYLGPARSGPNRLEHLSGVDEWMQSGDGSGLVQELLNRPEMLGSINRSLSDLEVPYRLHAERLSLADSPSVGEYAVLSLKDMRSDTNVSLRDVGYGLSQMLPILASVTSRRTEMVIVEQPELHLHPNLQANLVESLARACIERNKQLVLETHSENMLLRIQKMIRHQELSRDQVSVVYVGNSGDEGAWVQSVQFNADGTMATAWPGDFFESRMREWT